MKPLAEHMSVCAAHHSHPVNRGTPLVFVPVIVWALVVALHLVPLASSTVGALLLWYMVMDLALAVAAAAGPTALLVGAITLDETVATVISLWTAGVLLVASGGSQVVGHCVWGKPRPALAGGLLQAFVAPLFIISKAAFTLLRKPLEAEIEQRMQAHLPGAA